MARSEDSVTRVSPGAIAGRHKVAPLLAMAAVMILALALPAAATAEGQLRLPPRHLAPTPGPKAGAYIRLNVAAPGGAADLTTAWTLVQWQDRQGVWHDIDGWRGLLDDPGSTSKTWWVSDSDFGKGPFRWVVRRGSDGADLGASAGFSLPTDSYQLLDVAVTID